MQKREGCVIKDIMVETSDVKSKLHEMLAQQSENLRLIEDAIRKGDIDALLQLVEEGKVLCNEIETLAADNL